VGRNLPRLGQGPAPKKPSAAQTSATQGTGPQGFDVTGASTVSYITSFLPGESKPTTMTEAELNKQLIEMTPQERIAYATKLKNAGYSVGPITGAVTKDLRRSWLSAHSDLQTEIQAGQALDISSFLAANAGAGGAGKAGKSISTSQINDTDAAAIVNSVYQQLTGAAATPEDILKHTRAIRTAQKANPTTTVYDGTGKSTTTGGVNVQQLVTQGLEGTAPVEQQRTRDALTLAAQELGGLR
jgi:hypothetical protein